MYNNIIDIYVVLGWLHGKTVQLTLID